MTTKMTAELTPKQRLSVSHISGLVLVNAMIFQEILAEQNSDVLPLRKLVAKEKDVIDGFANHWRHIIDDINYYPIFHVAREILLNIPANKDSHSSILRLVLTAQTIVRNRAALRHDLMGRIYHRLLAEAKYLGTYYTSIPAATLLMKLALQPPNWQMDWTDLGQLKNFRVTDLACGTGTLLMAAADVIADNYINASASAGKSIDLGALHKLMAEDVIYGFDVLISALHLTASTLSMRSPHVTFKKMRLFSLPLGGQDKRLGSIEFLRSESVQLPMDLFGSAPVYVEVSPKEGKKTKIPVKLPELDLCAMNPPFVRSVGGNLLFGSLPVAERARMQTLLKQVVRNSQASITAGLGSVFVATADPHMKVGGRMALVLPKASLSGVAWAKTRNLLSERYRVEYIIVSQDAMQWNFSESTSLSEVLLIARKIHAGEKQPNEFVNAICLWRNPQTSFEALAIAQQIMNDPAPDVEKCQGALVLTIGQQKVGEATRISWKSLQGCPSWLLPVSFAQTDLTRLTLRLISSGALQLPGQKEEYSVALSKLGDLGGLGPDARDIHDGFKTTKETTAFPSFWGHSCDEIISLDQKPNQNLSPLSSPKPGRNLRKTEDLWPLAGTVLLAERLRLNTQRLVAVRLNRAVLSNTWWPMSLRRRSPQTEKAVTLWLNSTLGLLVLLAHRQETEGPWVKFKKPPLSAMPILDCSKLRPEALEKMEAAFDEIRDSPILPLPKMEGDPIREKIDKTISEVLNLPDLSPLRQLLAQEPIISSKQL
jgi:hypothetical protein